MTKLTREKERIINRLQMLDERGEWSNQESAEVELLEQRLGEISAEIANMIDVEDSPRLQDEDFQSFHE